MKVTNSLNSLNQLLHTDSAPSYQCIGRYINWQMLRLFHRLPRELFLSNSRLVAYSGSGTAPLVYWMGLYDYNNMNLIQLLLRNFGGTFVDVGANIGTYTLVASEIADAVVVSIEANPRTYVLLQENLRANQRKNVISLNVALSDHAGKILITDGNENAINHVVNNEEEALQVVKVECSTLDRICDQLSLIPSYVKIDVEGHEYPVLMGFIQKLGNASLLQIEQGEKQEIRRFLNEVGYLGPFYFHYRNRIFSSVPQKRAEDPVFISRKFEPYLKVIGLRYISNIQ